MEYNSGTHKYYIPSISTTMSVAAAWLAFVAAALVWGMGTVASTGDALVTLIMAMVIASASAAALVISLRARGAEEHEAPLQATLDAQQLRNQFVSNSDRKAA